MKEAPEGIVLYSWSGGIPDNVVNGISNPNNGRGSLIGITYVVPDFTPSQLQSQINKSGVISVGSNAYIDFSDLYGTKYPNNEKLVLSNAFVETLDLISEGPIEGPISGEYIYSGNLGQTGWSMATFSGYSVPTGFDSNNNNWNNQRYLRSIYWDEVPVLSDNAQLNFQNVNVAFSIGEPNGSNLQTIISKETTSRTLGERLRGGTDQIKYYRILNSNCNGVIINIKIGGLSITNSNNGNIGRDRIDYNISYRPLFSNLTTQTDFNSPLFETVWGKIVAAGGYIKSTRIDFNTSSFLSKTVAVKNSDSNNSSTVTVDSEVTMANFINNPNFIGWEIKIVRTTSDTTTSLQQNITYIDSLTELYGMTLTYPYSAIFRATFNAEFFSQIPERAFECKLLKVKIPGNYDPIKRTYATDGFATTNGFWDGTFATGKYWTNNPAWCFYDLMTNNRYGLGRFVDSVYIDPFTLYKIGQYCDGLVADGFGGLEPRFTCNVYFTSRDDAFKVINDMASIFRGMVYYAFGTVWAVQDSEKSPRVIFTNANVENGDFNYSTTSKKVRQSVAIVRYNDPNNFYKPAMEYVEDVDAIRRYGIRELDLTAFGCTSRGQAIRLANWALLSNNLETETIQFNGGIEASTLRPGDIFKTFDFNRKWKRYGGRVWTIDNTTLNPTGSIVTLDSPIEIQSGIQYNLSVLTPSYYYDTSQVSGINDGNYNQIRNSFLQQFVFNGDNHFISGNKSVITLSNSFDAINYSISGNPIFTVELGPDSQNYTGSRYFTNSNYDYYRVLNLKETDINKYEIIGIQYNSNKFLQIESGITYQRQSLNNLDKTPNSPHDLSLNVFNLSSQRQLIQYAFLVDNFNFINNYRVYVTTGNFPTLGVPDNSYLFTSLPVDIVQGSYLANQSGKYTFKVFSYNETDNIYSTSSASGSVNINTDLSIRDVSIGSLQLI